jgi:hypothetical protein
VHHTRARTITFGDMCSAHATNTRRTHSVDTYRNMEYVRLDVETKRSHSRGARARTLSLVGEVHACVETIRSAPLASRHITSHITTLGDRNGGQE